VLLCRLQGREEVVFGATVSGRPGSLPGIEGLVGLCINASLCGCVWREWQT